MRHEFSPNSAWEEGRVAFQAGQPEDANPYRNDPTAHKFDALCWSNGWWDMRLCSEVNDETN